MQVNTDVSAVLNEDYITKQYDALEKDLNSLENFFDLNCAIPIWGSIAGIAIQFFGLLKVGAFFINNNALITNSRMIGVVVHLALDALLVGPLEVVPLVGTAVYIMRIWKAYNVGDSRLYVTTGHDHKFLPYSSLVAKDWKIEGSNKELVAKARSMYEVEIYNYGGEGKIPLELRLNIARGIVDRLLKRD